jgi:hypothetical protein
MDVVDKIKEVQVITNRRLDHVPATPVIIKSVRRAEPAK